MLRKKHRAKAEPRNLLTLRPVRRKKSEVDEAGNEVILIPRFGDHKLGRFLMARLEKTHHRLKLDDIGTFAWRRFDGRTSVSEVADAMKKKFGDKVDPVYERLSRFITQLVRAGVLQLP